MSVEERRKFPRLPLNVSVEYTILAHKEAENILTRSKNISAGGIRIILLEKVEPGTLLELKISFPESKDPIVSTGRVAWIDEFIVGDSKEGKAYEAGIEFKEIDSRDREKIKKYVITNL